MRVLIGGLMGLCLLASMPIEAHARSDSRAAAQSRAGATRALPTPPRANARPAMNVTSAHQPSVSAGRYATAPSAGRNVRVQSRDLAFASRGSLSRYAAPQRGRAFAVVPYGRAMAQAPSPYRQTAMANCTIRSGRRLCTSGATRSVAFRWGSDLGAQSMAQSSCPDGTIATIAVGHTDVVRCVPL